MWHFAIERGVLWNDVIRAKYGEQEGGGVLVKCDKVMVLQFGGKLGDGDLLSMLRCLFWWEMGRE